MKSPLQGKGPGGLEGRPSPPGALQTLLSPTARWKWPCPRTPPGGEAREPTRHRSGHRTQVVPHFYVLGSPREVGRDRRAYSFLTGAPSRRPRDTRSSTVAAAGLAGGGAESMRRPHPTDPETVPHDRVSEGSGALAFVFLYFFISHTH